jgi:hypothetical protein
LALSRREVGLPYRSARHQQQQVDPLSEVPPQERDDASPQRDQQASGLRPAVAVVVVMMMMMMIMMMRMMMMMI